ncbi:uncharacterized protein EDB91DRAFT_1085691 [Suillus paluster]|uniref:uncharacterized protein n=1 Tax=Suillus paluster TaxID=48578 RepID=UPI001B866BAC|nr:uncharacterized protein EDB91DRAFT_1085691 [Suillus paluster]KAG1729664.1 hypothetical protein EDB91DRAFT_1085691 [Suillus paluster]
MEITHAMQTFVDFAKEAWLRSHSASDAVKYACQNWAVHLSQALNPRDGMLNHRFKAFWNGHLLSWLERQWCLKGLRFCLIVLSDGHKLAKEYLQAPGTRVACKVVIFFPGSSDLYASRSSDGQHRRDCDYYIPSNSNDKMLGRYAIK